ncbi:hypothetical protein F5878DRAFT_644968 [Lentinula raphanica]|uniref:DUF6830 domain-containing protein n=1 Tax=Lentinula raphanica TaxID=153919 RepID=A0AA38P1M4_9AGAR|nr:hypothetical protein F5878DRAFT_644968 [Lentinula raphanica]
MFDFRYAGQAPRFNDTTALRVQKALDEFHEVKAEVLKLGGRLNSKGEPLENWEIPKLEFMQSVLPSIKSSGPLIQWDANKTERAHITMVKLPARAGNGRDYEVQICRELDLHSHMRHFDLMTSMKDANIDFRMFNNDEEINGGNEAALEPVPLHSVTSSTDASTTPSAPASTTSSAPASTTSSAPASTTSSEPAATTSSIAVTTTADLRQHIVPVSEKIWGSTRPSKDLFSVAAALLSDLNTPRPLRSFIGNKGQTAFHLIREPDLKKHTVRDAQALFQLPDFAAALSDYLERAKSGTSTFAIAGRRTVNDASTEFPFAVKIWSKLQIQGKQYHDIHQPNDTHTVFATPPNPGPEGEFRRNDCVLINVNDQSHCAVIVKMIFALAYPRNSLHHPRTDEFLAYCESPRPRPAMPTSLATRHGSLAIRTIIQGPGCYVLRKAVRANGQPFGDVIPVSQFRAQIDVTPRHKGAADPHLTCSNVMVYATDYLLNKFWEKELCLSEKNLAFYSLAVIYFANWLIIRRLNSNLELTSRTFDIAIFTFINALENTATARLNLKIPQQLTKWQDGLVVHYVLAMRSVVHVRHLVQMDPDTSMPSSIAVIFGSGMGSALSIPWTKMDATYCGYKEEKSCALTGLEFGVCNTHSSKQPDDSSHDLTAVAYPPRPPHKQTDNRTFWQKVLPESLACRFYVITVLVETTIDLTIEAELLLRVHETGDSGNVKESKPNKMPVYLSIFSLAQQTIWLVLQKTDWEYYVTCTAMPLSLVLLVEGHLAARHEIATRTCTM